MENTPLAFPVTQHTVHAAVIKVHGQYQTTAKLARVESMQVMVYETKS